MRRILILAATAAMVLCTAFNAGAQTRTVSGTVLDTQQQPLVGAAVLVSGTTNGEVTGLDGSFSLRVPSGDVTLEVSCLGYTTQTVVVPSTQAKISVTLEEDNMMLEETVVVGYGVQKKVNLTGAVTSVDAKELADRTAHNVTNMLQGSVPGLNITTSAGNPGSAGSLNIRGVTSINEADPLVLIDGVEGELSRVNPGDVASISVIKDASAAAIYGARAAYGVILVTTKSGSDNGSKATVRYSGRWGWEEPTTSTDYETRGYWSVYITDLFFKNDPKHTPYTSYTEHDMAELLARVNDVTENPERPWVVRETRNGKDQWIYYCNTDWYHELYRDQHPVQQHNISLSGGNKDIKYYLSGGYDRQTGIIKANPDVFQKFNLRAKIDFRINKWTRMSNNTSFYNSIYSFPGVNNVQDSFQLSSRHALASFPLKNPDGTWIYSTPLIAGGYNVANGRHIAFGMDKDKNLQRRNDFANTTELKITPIKQLTLTANYTYRMYQNRDTHRKVNFPYRIYPDSEVQYYITGAGEDQLKESVVTNQYHAGNAYLNYDDTFADAHHLAVTAGSNIEYWYRKSVGAVGKNLLSQDLNDLDLVGENSEGITDYTASGGQSAYALIGFFGRLNYDYKGRYLFEASGRFDGTSRFKKGHRWGFFPSASLGWRISEEPFFSPARKWVDNLKIRASYGSLGNQVVGSNYAYLRQITFYNFGVGKSGYDPYGFNEGTTTAKYASLGAPVSGDLTWETSIQYNLGLDVAAFKNRLTFTAEAYIRDTKNMLTEGVALPEIYGADAPKENAADLRTKGYELSLGWKDQFKLFGQPFGYGIKGTLSDYRSYITRYDNPTKSFAKDYYEGERLGDIWGYVVDGLFTSDEEAKNYTTATAENGGKYYLDCSGLVKDRMDGGFLAGDLRFVDLDNDGHYKLDENGKVVLDENGNKILLPEEEWRPNTLSNGSNTVDDPGDRKILGNSLPSLQYGFTLQMDYMGFDASVFFQGTGDHYWYPAGMNYAFWGAYSYSYLSFLPRDFINKVWSEDNPNTYFPRPRAYSSTGGELRLVNSRYLQNIRYLRLKNLTVGYTVPQNLTRKIKLEKARVYFSGENLAYWSPLKKVTEYLDPESAFRRTSGNTEDDHMAYPWMKTFMFGIDITF